MTRKPSVHTVHKPIGRWANKVGGQTVSAHRTKETAIERGRNIARVLETEHAIHNLEGTIGRKTSYGNDANPPKGPRKNN